MFMSLAQTLYIALIESAEEGLGSNMNIGLEETDITTLKGIGINVLILVVVTLSLIAVAMIIDS